MHTYKLIGQNDEFYKLATAWNDLLGRSSIANPFLTWDWMYYWWDTYSKEIPNISLCIITVNNEDRLIGILPGFIQVKNKIRTFYFFGSKFESSDYLEMICAETESTRTVLEGALKYLQNQRIIDVLAFTGVLIDSFFNHFLKEFAVNNRFRLFSKFDSVCPFIDIHCSWKDYVQGLSKNMRYNLGRRTRKIQNKFNAEFGIVTNSSEIDAAIDELFLLHQAWFSQRKKKDSFQGNLRVVFHKKLALSFFKQDILRIFQLKVRNKTIAVLYCYEYAKQLFYFQAGSDPEWAKYSVGLVIMGHAIQYAHENGLARFDFLRGDEDYKFNWTNNSRIMGSVYLGISGKGKIVVLQKTLYINLKRNIKRLLMILGVSRFSHDS